MFRGFWGALLLVVMPTATLAEVVSVETRGNFSCVPISGFEATIANDELVRVNNFTIHEKVGSRSYAAGIQVSFAITNLSISDVFLTADFILFDADQQPLAAVNAAPPKLRIASQGAAIASGVTTVASGTLAKTGTVCLRWFADRYE